MKIISLRPTFTSTLALLTTSFGARKNCYNNTFRCRYINDDHCSCRPTIRFARAAAAAGEAAKSQSTVPTSSFTTNTNSKNMIRFQIHESFRDIVHLYDGFILDQFGVLHNGVNPLEGAIELVQYLYEKGKKLIILSNTSAPSRNALQKLEKLGFDQIYFVDAVTSGEEASKYVQQVYCSKKEMVKVIFITWDSRIPNNPRLTASPQAFLNACGSNVEVVDNVKDADLILLHGSEVWYRGNEMEPIGLDSYIDTGIYIDNIIDEILQQCIQSNIPMICANPDEIVITPSNTKAFMPGRIAKRYIELGGSCRMFGKPNVEHFESCIDILQVKDRQRIAHVGDSLQHDIVGANNANIPSIFITSGIHTSDLDTSSNFGAMPKKEALNQLFQDESVYPIHVIPAFRL